MKRIDSTVWLLGWTLIAGSLVASEQPSHLPVQLTLSEAIERTLQLSPENQLSTSRISAQKGNCVQASAYPNPAFAYSAENVFGNREWRGWRAAESRYDLSQRIELGGKRASRIALARVGILQAKAAHALKQRELRLAATLAYCDLFEAQALIEFTSRQNALLDQWKTIANSPEAIDKLGPLQALQIRLKANQSAREHFALERDFAIKKQALALLWGENCPELAFDRVAPLSDTPAPPSSLCALREQLDAHPDLALAKLAHLGAHRNLQLAQADAIPDVDLLIGYKTEREGSHRGMVLGAEIPLPLFDSNQGAIYRARAEKRESQIALCELNRQLDQRLEIAYTDYLHSFQLFHTLRADGLPAAQTAFDRARESYRSGKISQFELIQEELVYLDSQKAYLQALVDCYRKRAWLDTFTP